MKILVVTSKFPPEYSGPGVRIPKLYEAIGTQIGVTDKQCYCNGIEQSSCACYEHKGFNTKRFVSFIIRNAVLTRIPMPQRLRRSLVYFHETLQALSDLQAYKNVDLVHILGHSGATAAALHWAGKHNIPVLMELVTASALPQQRFLFGKAALPEKGAVITLTDRTRRRCLDRGYPNAKIWSRPNPINEDVFKPEPERQQDLRSRLTPFAASDILIASVAKMIPQKNQILLVEALRHLPERYKLVIAGPAVTKGILQDRDSQYINDMKGRIERYGLQNRVHLVIDFVDASEYMKAADLYALPAWDEGFGTPMMEAIACGLPVVANADEPPFREWIREAENGCLRDIADPKAWAEGFETAARIPQEKRIDESVRIRDLAGQKRIYAEYIRLIKELTEN